MPGILDGDISKEAAIRPHNLFRPVPHLPPLSDHARRPPVPAP